MASSAAFAARLGLGLWLSALFLGLAASAALAAFLRRGDGRGGRRLSAAAVAASAAVAGIAWVVVGAARSGFPPSGAPAYAAAGLAMGLLAGLFPRAAGVPLVVTAAVAAALAAAGLSGWKAWDDGAAVARLVVFDASDEALLCGLSLDGDGPGTNVRLGPGPVTLSVDRLDLRGPLVAFYGPRLYRLGSLESGGVRVALSEPGLRLPEALARALGLSASVAASPAFEAADLGQAGFALGADGGLSLVLPPMASEQP